MALVCLQLECSHTLLSDVRLAITHEVNGFISREMMVGRVSLDGLCVISKPIRSGNASYPEF